jgi:hypothetical protein
LIESTTDKIVTLLAPGVIVNTAAFAPLVLDTLGFDYVDIYVQLGFTDIALTVLKLMESDVEASATTLTSGTLVPGTDYSVSPQTLPASGSDALIAFHVNCTGARKRYLLPAITIGTGSTGGYVVAWAVLSRGDIASSTAAQRGLSQEVFVS